MCFLSLPACFCKVDIVILEKKKKLKPLGGQTKLSAQHQEQAATTAIQKDEAKVNEDNEISAQAKSAKCKEQRFFEPWLKT